MKRQCGGRNNYQQSIEHVKSIAQKWTSGTGQLCVVYRDESGEYRFDIKEYYTKKYPIEFETTA